MNTNRQDVILFNEGQVLQYAARLTVRDGIEQARGAIDGCFNALVRLEGPEEAAKFAFSVADRVVGNLKGGTSWPIEPPQAIAVSPPPPVPEPRRYGFWTIFIIGWLCAAVPASVVIARLWTMVAR